MTLGYLLFEDEHVVRVAASLGYSDDGSTDSFIDPITIPRCAVTRLRLLRLP